MVPKGKIKSVRVGSAIAAKIESTPGTDVPPDTGSANFHVNEFDGGIEGWKTDPRNFQVVPGNAYSASVMTNLKDEPPFVIFYNDAGEPLPDDGLVHVGYDAGGVDVAVVAARRHGKTIAITSAENISKMRASTEMLADNFRRHFTEPMAKAIQKMVAEASEDRVVAWIGDEPVTVKQMREMTADMGINLSLHDATTLGQLLTPKLSARDLAVKPEAPPRRPDYLKHDPSKSHKPRHGRRRK